VQAYDERWTTYLQLQGIIVLRFLMDLVFRELIVVLECIAITLRDGPSP